MNVSLNKHVRNKLSRRIRELRSSYRINLAECSRVTGLSIGTISRIEDNKTYYNPSLGVLVKLAEAYNVSVSELLDGVHEAKKLEGK